VTSINF